MIFGEEESNQKCNATISADVSLVAMPEHRFVPLTRSYADKTKPSAWAGFLASMG
jgi:hypothetical protein